MAEPGDWSDQDNPPYQGKIDRVYTSMTQYHDAPLFIDLFLKQRGYALSTWNRRLIAAELEHYEGEDPYRIEELTDFLEQRLR